jgi:hypothetical protein
LEVEFRPILRDTVEHHPQVLLQRREIRDVGLMEAWLEECMRVLPLEAIRRNETLSTEGTHLRQAQRLKAPIGGIFGPHCPQVLRMN